MGVRGLLLTSYSILYQGYCRTVKILLGPDCAIAQPLSRMQKLVYIRDYKNFAPCLHYITIVCFITNALSEDFIPMLLAP